MIEAALNGSMGSWSPSAIFASLGNAIDRVADQGSSPAASTGAAASFERALAEELLRAGDVDQLDIAFDLQNGALLNRAGEPQLAGGRNDHVDSAASIPTDAADNASAAGSHRRVGFDDSDASARPFAGGDGFDQSLKDADPAAFWVGDRIVDHPAFRGAGSSFMEDPMTEPIPTGRVLFNGDGRPIILPAIDIDYHDEPSGVDSAPADEGDLMILPDGAVIAYDPWTAAVDGDLIH